MVFALPTWGPPWFPGGKSEKQKQQHQKGVAMCTGHFGDTGIDAHWSWHGALHKSPSLNGTGVGCI